MYWCIDRCILHTLTTYHIPHTTHHTHADAWYICVCVCDPICFSCVCVVLCVCVSVRVFKRKQNLLSAMSTRFMSSSSEQKKPVRIAVTGAAGQIGYALLFRIAAYVCVCAVYVRVYGACVGVMCMRVLLYLYGNHNGDTWLCYWTHTPHTHAYTHTHTHTHTHNQWCHAGPEPTYDSALLGTTSGYESTQRRGMCVCMWCVQCLFVCACVLDIMFVFMMYDDVWCVRVRYVWCVMYDMWCISVWSVM